MHVIERVIALALVVLFTSASGFFFYLLVVWIVGRRGLHEPFSWQQFGIDLCCLAGGLGFLAHAQLYRSAEAEWLTFGVAESKRGKGTIVRVEDPTWLRDRF